MKNQKKTITERMNEVLGRMFGKKKDPHSAQPMELHPDMNPEMRALIQNMDRALLDVHKYCSEHESGRKEDSEPENYFAFQFVMFYNEGEHSITRNMTHLNGKDQKQVLETVLRTLSQN